MKPRMITVICISCASVILASCTTTTRTTETSRPAYDQTTKRVYTQEQMRKTGEQSPAAALEKLDASVTVSGNRN